MTALALEDLEPALWGTLSDELLHIVFLRLPVPEFNQIRLLSKSWKRSIGSVDSYLSRVLEDTVYPNLFGFVDLENLRARVFDVKRDQWYIRGIDPSFEWTLSVGAADGGLFCFASESTMNYISLVVMNPLTGENVELPHLPSLHNEDHAILPPMVQLTMDRQTDQYKVVVVGYAQNGNRGFIAQVYDSRTKQWSVVGSGEESGGRIFGYEYSWIWMVEYSFYREEQHGPCVYGFAEGQLQRFSSSRITEGRSAISDALLGERLFVLHKKSRDKKRRAGPSNLIQRGQKRKYYISEYHFPKNGTAWVMVETHGCDPLEDYHPEEDHPVLSLHACKGFLMVTAQVDSCAKDDRFVHDKYEFVWLYNLSIYKWQTLPKMPGRISCDSVDLMCELRWSARP